MSLSSCSTLRRTISSALLRSSSSPAILSVAEELFLIVNAEAEEVEFPDVEEDDLLSAD